MPEKLDKQYLTRKEVAALLSVSQKTIYRMGKEGILKVYPIPKHDRLKRYKLAEVYEVFSSRQNKVNKNNMG